MPFTVDEVSPSNGPTAGGTAVIISVSNPPFNSTLTGVTFGGVPAASFSPHPPNAVAAVTPPHVAGAVDVEILSTGGNATGHNLYTYIGSPLTVTGISPSSGTTAGGTPVTIVGTGFDGGVTGATVGGVPITSRTVVSPTQITGLTGAHAAGAVDVVVTTGSGSATGTGLYTYTAPAPPPPPTAGSNIYIIERLDNRIWPTVEDCWCVDCAFTLEQPTPAAALTISSATGAGILTGVNNLVGGQNYSSATTAQVIDENGLGPGTGAIPMLTISGGVITGVAFAPGGSNYVSPVLVISDPENSGTGASAVITMDNSATATASGPVFSSGNVGSVIRSGYGVMAITSFLDTEHVIVNIISPIVQVQPDDPTGLPIVQASGNWTMTAPISQFYLPQLAGFNVTGLADGQIIPLTLVPHNGIVTLARPASAIIVGLPFQAQLQSTYLDAGEPTVQGQRKKIGEVTVRIEQSAGFQVGANQPDGSVQSPQQLFTKWQNMVDAPTHAVPAFGAQFTPLFTGDIRVPIPGGFNTRGQVAVQQLNPLPLQVLDYVPEVLGGDEPNQKAPKRQQGRGGEGQ